MSRCRKKNFNRVTMLFGAMACFGMYYYFNAFQWYIYEFYPVRDTQSIVEVFEKNRKYIVDDDDYLPDFMLKHRTPDNDPKHFGTLKIKVLREGSKLAGFVAYHMKNSQEGVVLFLAVDHCFRGKRYGHALMLCAINDLFLMGARSVCLWVLTDNIPARRVYKELGFVEKYYDDEKKNNIYLECSKES